MHPQRKTATRILRPALQFISVPPDLLEDGSFRVRNDYDHLSRRTAKHVERWYDSTGEWRPWETCIFVYDGWNPVLETIVSHVAGTTNTVRYLWGLDLSETLQGAGGVGGLVAVIRDGATYFPSYDANGNITEYVSESGAVVASYVYDAFGNLLFAAGPMADLFSHRFSTKYFDPETGLYYYGYRFYSPLLGRWINRDPIEEEGGENLYCFVKNSPCTFNDALGTEIYKTIILQRKHARYYSAIRSFFDSDYPDGDYYGHWWIEFDGESYGWWPSSQVGIGETFLGIKGTVNGIDTFGGDSTHDPHHGDSADEEFNPQRKNHGEMKYGMAKGRKCKCTDENEAKDCIRTFANQYSGNWSFPLNSCHTFQERAMSNCCLTR